MTLSQLVAYLAQNKRYISNATLRAVKAEAASRLKARFAQDRADSPLVFDDLIERCERDIAGA